MLNAKRVEGRDVSGIILVVQLEKRGNAFYLLSAENVHAKGIH